MGGLATTPRLTGSNPPVVGGCPNRLVPHIAVVDQILHHGVQVACGQREQVGIRSVIFSCQALSILVLVMVKMFPGKPCSSVAPARCSDSMPCTESWGQGWGAPCQHPTGVSVCPRLKSLSPCALALCRTSPCCRYRDTSPFAGSTWNPQTPWPLLLSPASLL